MARTVVLTSMLVNTITKQLYNEVQPVHKAYIMKILDKKREVVKAYYDALSEDTKELLSYMHDRDYNTTVSEIIDYLEDKRPELFNNLPSTDTVDTDYILEQFIQSTVRDCYTNMQDGDVKVTAETLKQCTRDKVAEKYYPLIQKFKDL